MNFRKLPVIILTLALCTYAQINLMSPGITFRDANTAANTTIHYGNLNLTGGNAGTNYGRLSANSINVSANGINVMGFGWFANDLEVDGYSSFWNDHEIHGMTYQYADAFQWGILENYGAYAYFAGDLWVGGVKSFVQPHPTDSTKAIKYIAIESGEALTLVRGSAKTSYGTATIALPEHFGLVTSDEVPLTVLLTPEKAPVLLYTKEKSKSQLVVAMKDSDLREFGDADFSWQVTGVRDGFENLEVIVDVDKDGKLVEKNPVSQKRKTMQEKAKKMFEKEKQFHEKKGK